MSSYKSFRFETVLIRSVVALAFVTGLGMNFEAKADNHLFSLKKIFPKGKCSPVAPNYELLIAGFAGGQITKYKIYNTKGKVVETISTLFNKERDQWVIVGSQTDKKVIFCLYSSGVGKGSVERQSIK